MKKRTRFALVFFLPMIVVLFLLWRLVSLGSLPPILYYSLILVGVIAAICWALYVIPIRQAEALEKQRALIKPTELFSMENEARKTLSQIIGGFVVIAGLFVTGVNLLITSNLTREGQITDSLMRTIPQLGDAKLIVRLGGIYALERIARDSEKDRRTIMDILTAYVRENASRRKLEPKNESPSTKKSAMKDEEKDAQPPADIQAILTVIGRSVGDREKDRIDLSNAFLRQADLSEANLSSVDLRKADLGSAKLIGGNLIWADLSEAILYEADLSGATLSGATLREADLGGTKLFHATLREADLSGAKNLMLEQIAEAIIDSKTKLPAEIEEKHRDALKTMREKTEKKGL